MTLQNVREDIPLVSKCIYMHSASSCPCPLPVIRAMSQYYEKMPVNYGAKASRIGREVTALVDEARQTIATFIGAKHASEIVFTKNTTEAINIVANGLDWRAGDEVVVTLLEHQSNIIPWMRQLQEHGGELRIVEPNAEGLVEPAAIQAALTSHTKIICLAHVSNTLGTIQPVQEVGKIAREHGVLFLVDAAQSEGRMPVDVTAMQCDFLVSCGRKALMGPQGTGFLYGRMGALEALRPMIAGSKAANLTGASSFQFLDSPHRFEAGVLNTAGMIGLGRAVEYVQAIGTERILAHLQKLTVLLRSELRNLPHVQLFGTEKPQGQTGIVSWNVKGRDCHEVAAALDETASIVAGAGACGSYLAMRYLGVEGVVRTSLHCFNTEQEIYKVLEVVSGIRA